MRKLYQAENGLDAKLVSDLLTRLGIENEIHGQYLQGGIGELPVGGFVHVLVNEDDFDEARKLVDEWEARQSLSDTEERDEEDDETNTTTPPKTGSWISFIVGFMAAIICIVLFVCFSRV